MKSFLAIQQSTSQRNYIFTEFDDQQAAFGRGFQRHLEVPTERPLVGSKGNSKVCLPEKGDAMADRSKLL
jgi:hypothetical protein